MLATVSTHWNPEKILAKTAALVKKYKFHEECLDV